LFLQMPFVNAQFDSKRLDNALQARARGFKPNLSDEMDAVGRMIAVSLATSAQPYGVGAGSQQKGAAAVAGDIGKIYATVSQVYGAISDNADEPTAKSFYSALRKGDQAKALVLIATYAPEYSVATLGQFDGGTLHRERRNKRGRIPKSQKVLLIVTNPAALRKYIQHEVDQV